MDHNAAVAADEQFNLVAAVIGNGCVNDTVQNTNEYIKFQHAQNLIPSTSSPRNMVSAEAEMVKHLGYTPNYYDYRIESVNCGACYGYNYTAWSYWFLRDDVKQALSICGDAGEDAFSGNAGGCISMGAFDSRDSFDYSGALGRALDAGIAVALYYGKTDTACNYVGGMTMANTISWSGRDAFASMPLTAIEIAGVEAGQTKSHKGLMLFQIRITITREFDGQYA